jgi:SsrA-binding protein
LKTFNLLGKISDCLICFTDSIMAEDKQNSEKNIVTNRKARHEYEIIDRIETGLVLLGSEVKSLRDGKASLADAYARVMDGEVWVIGMHISPYKQANFEPADPLRDRKLLLHKREIKKLNRQVMEKGITLIPLRLYFKNNIAKVELGLCRGKRQYDKKRTIAQRDAQREMQREEKEFGKR